MANEARAIWISRGLMTGIVYGVVGGSVIPILGSIFLTPVFVPLSVLIGVVTAVAGGGSIERERKIVTLLMIAATTPVVAATIWNGNSPLWPVPAVGGLIAHTWIAGRPQSGSLRTTYTGDVSRKTSHLLLFVLPVMTLAVALLIGAFVL